MLAIKSKKSMCWLISAGALTCLTLSGCAGTGMLQSRYGDQSDACHAYREPLIRTENHFSQDITQGIVVGAILGGIAGAVLGDKPEDIFIGMGLGALGGAAGGYIRAKQRQASDQAELRQAIYQDVTADSSQVGALGRSLRSLNACRANEVAQLRADFESGAISGQEARRRIAVVRSAIADDNQLVREILHDVNERNGVYVESLAAVERRTQEEVRGAADRYQPKVTRAGTLVARSNANMRSGPSTRSPVIMNLSAGQQVTSFGKTGDGKWYSIQAGSTQGYVYHALLGNPSTNPSGTRVLPVVAKEQRPKSTTQVEELLIETKEVDAEYQQQVANLEQDMSDLEVLLI